MTGSRAAARFAVVVGALGVLAVPVGIIAAQSINSLGLLRALYITVPLAIALGLLGVLLTRRARLGAQRTVFSERRGPLRTARMLAWLAVYVGATSGVSLIVYWALRARH